MDRDSWGKRSLAAIIILAVLVVAFIFYRLLAKNGAGQPKNAGQPLVSLKIENGLGGEKFTVNWQNIASDTRILNIYKSKNGADGWTFWGSVPVSNGSHANGAAEIDGGRSLSGDSFYFEAVSGGGAPPSVIWTSSPTTPPTPPVNPQNPPALPPAPSGSPSGPSIPSFQVSNSNTWVEVTWQNLPSSTTLVVISRADNPSGPWTMFFSEPNSPTTNPYTVRVAVDTPHTPFFYELEAYDGSTLIGTYGPVYLSAIQQ